MAGTAKKVIVIGLDGFEPSIVDTLFAAGELPNLARLRERGGYGRLETTYPAQTPVAWSTFATGTNPGGHGIFDFIRRDPKTYRPDLGLNRYEQTSVFLPPRAVNLRRGKAVWEMLSDAGVPAVVLRCPCTYPPDEFRGRLLAGMGVPDLQGSYGTATLYTSASDVQKLESENIRTVKFDADGRVTTELLGPRNPKTKGHFTTPIVLRVDVDAGRVVVESDGQPPVLSAGLRQWSDWLKVKFRTGILQSVRGMLRFFLIRTAPVIELYASPVNFDPEAPLFRISTPPEYARELAAGVGTYYTTGMVEEHSGLNNGRLDEAAFLQQCAEVVREREKMLHHELQRQRAGLCFCLFDTPDRLQHMFWRFRDPAHPAYPGVSAGEMVRAIEDHYRACDDVVGRALKYADDQTLFIVLSDHGFGSFRRAVNLNAWLHAQGLLVLKGARPEGEADEFFRGVDWGRTRAYALGLAGIYLNIRGREGEGFVPPGEAPALQQAIADCLGGLTDPGTGRTAIQSVLPRERIYKGPYVEEAPDLVVNCAEGYRVSWTTGLGGVGTNLFEDNTRKWSGDHIVDPALVPGVVFMNRPFRPGARLIDLAPTILRALGVPRHPALEGESLLP